MADADEKARQDAIYAKEPWANLAVAAGYRPWDTETSARRAFDFAATLLAARDARIAALEAGLRDCVSAMTAEIFLYPKRKKRDPLLAAEQRARALLDGGKP